MLTWIDQVENILRANEGVELLSLVHVRRASTVLKDAAWSWYHSVTRNESRFSFATWQAFRDSILDAFQPKNNEMIMRRRLRSCKQMSTVIEYVYRFRDIFGQIPSMGEADRIENFVEGLRPVTAGEVEYRSPGTLEEAICFAQAFDDTHLSRSGKKKMNNEKVGRNDRNRGRRSEVGGFGSFVVPARNDPTDGVAPMELDNMARGNRENRQCFNCRKIGHIEKKSTRPKRNDRRHSLLERNIDEEMVLAPLVNEEESKLFKKKRSTDDHVELYEKEELHRVEDEVEVVSDDHALLRVMGTLEGVAAKFLIDSGATHNYIPLTIVKKMGMAMEAPEESGSIKLGNGERIPWLGTVKNLKFKIGGKFEDVGTFTVKYLK